MTSALPQSLPSRSKRPARGTVDFVVLTDSHLSTAKPDAPYKYSNHENQPPNHADLRESPNDLKYPSPAPTSSTNDQPTTTRHFILSVRQTDLEKLDKLKKDLLQGQHPDYCTDPYPAALAAYSLLHTPVSNTPNSPTRATNGSLLTTSSHTADPSMPQQTSPRQHGSINGDDSLTNGSMLNETQNHYRRPENTPGRTQDSSDVSGPDNTRSNDDRMQVEDPLPPPPSQRPGEDASQRSRGVVSHPDISEGDLLLARTNSLVNSYPQPGDPTINPGDGRSQQPSLPTPQSERSPRKEALRRETRFSSRPVQNNVSRQLTHNIAGAQLDTHDQSDHAFMSASIPANPTASPTLTFTSPATETTFSTVRVTDARPPSRSDLSAPSRTLDYTSHPDSQLIIPRVDTPDSMKPQHSVPPRQDRNYRPHPQRPYPPKDAMSAHTSQDTLMRDSSSVRDARDRGSRSYPESRGVYPSPTKGSSRPPSRVASGSDARSIHSSPGQPILPVNEPYNNGMRPRESSRNSFPGGYSNTYRPDDDDDDDDREPRPSRSSFDFRPVDDGQGGRTDYYEEQRSDRLRDSVRGRSISNSASRPERGSATHDTRLSPRMGPPSAEKKPMLNHARDAEYPPPPSSLRNSHGYSSAENGVPFPEQGPPRRDSRMDPPPPPSRMRDNFPPSSLSTRPYHDDTRSDHYRPPPSPPSRSVSPSRSNTPINRRESDYGSYLPPRSDSRDSRTWAPRDDRLGSLNSDSTYASSGWSGERGMSRSTWPPPPPAPPAVAASYDLRQERPLVPSIPPETRKPDERSRESSYTPATSERGSPRPRDYRPLPPIDPNGPSPRMVWDGPGPYPPRGDHYEPPGSPNSLPAPPPPPSYSAPDRYPSSSGPRVRPRSPSPPPAQGRGHYVASMKPPIIESEAARQAKRQRMESAKEKEAPRRDMPPPPSLGPSTSITGPGGNYNRYVPRDEDRDRRVSSGGGPANRGVYESPREPIPPSGSGSSYTRFDRPGSPPNSYGRGPPPPPPPRDVGGSGYVPRYDNSRFDDRRWERPRNTYPPPRD